jgi:ATP citrate (pro-S)-lyase
MPRPSVCIPSLALYITHSVHVVDLLTRPPPRPDGKILIIGGGIANFTNVAATFKGIIRALTSYKSQLIAHNAKIYVRRGGPNWQEGLKAMRLLGSSD